MTPDPRKQCITCKKYFDKETEFNKIRAMVLTRDRIEGIHQIAISEEVNRSIVELSQTMKETNTPYNEIIKLCIQSYKREQVNNFNGNDRLESIVLDNDSEEET